MLVQIPQNESDRSSGHNFVDTVKEFFSWSVSFSSLDALWILCVSKSYLPQEKAFI